MTGPELHVSGGVGGTSARYEDLATLGRHSDDVARQLATVSAECHGILLDPDLLASALLDPGGVARIQALLLAALDGPGGLSALAAGFGRRSAALRASAASYRGADEASRSALTCLRWAAGHAAGATVVAGLPVLAGVAGPALAYEALGGDIDYERLIVEHPGVVDAVVGAGPGLLSSVPGLATGDVPGAAALLAQFYPDGRPEVTDLGVADPTAPGAGVLARAPAGFGDLLGGLDHRNARADADAPDQIDVRVVGGRAGDTAYIVDIPGTKVWNAPGAHSPALHDLGTNLHALAGESTTRQHAVAEALRRAGAGPDDPVMLVGHSQGGLVAAQAARDSGAGGFAFNVTHVVAVGAPIGHVVAPSHVQVLSLENRHDIVPRLDAAENRDRPNVTTVSFDSQLGSIGANHSTSRSYLPAAVALDASPTPSVRAFRDSAVAFMPTEDAGTTTRTHVYALTRQP
ncbi:alpha/beta hydrolase [Pilimelia columellifera]|uniref:DUF1023 domain-containing protein n=1 Tax=Pilimelia columellifera subsp. columellifera TaxID=706583 RepID=A0ABP6A9H1_9ACTN